MAATAAPRVELSGGPRVKQGKGSSCSSSSREHHTLPGNAAHQSYSEDISTGVSLQVRAELILQIGDSTGPEKQFMICTPQVIL